MSNKKNAYTCPMLHSTVTIDKDKGVTPMFIGCPVCNERASSRMYNVDQSLVPTHEWFKPTEAELEKEAKSIAIALNANYKIIYAGLNDHVKQGGLIMQPINQPEPCTP